MWWTWSDVGEATSGAVRSASGSIWPWERNPVTATPGRVAIGPCPPTPSGCWRGSARPGRYAATAMSRCPPPCCVTCSSRPLGHPAARTVSRSGSSCSPTGPRRPRPSTSWAWRRGGHGTSSGPPTATTGVRVSTTRRRRPPWPGPWRPTSSTSTPCRPSILPCLVRHRAANPFEGASIYPACQNLLLAARALGYGGVMTSWNLLVDAELRSLLSIPDEVFVAAAITIGRPRATRAPCAAGRWASSSTSTSGVGRPPSPSIPREPASRAPGPPRPRA